MVQAPEKQSQASPLSDEGRRAARRAFMTGSLAAAPVIATLASRPAWACDTVSVYESANHASHYDGSTCYGMPPEYWRMKPVMVEQYVVEVGPPNAVDYGNLIAIPTDYSYPTDDDLTAAKQEAEATGNEEWKDAIKQYQTWLKFNPLSATPPFGTKFNEIFGPYADEYLTIMQALWLYDVQLLCQSACAWLNANEYPGGFGYAPDEVVMQFQTTGMENPDLLTAAFIAMNTASVPV